MGLFDFLRRKPEKATVHIDVSYSPANKDAADHKVALIKKFVEANGGELILDEIIGECVNKECGYTETFKPTDAVPAVCPKCGSDW